MQGLIGVGVILLLAGLLFLLMPLEKLQKAFRRMRSRTGTKVGGAVLIAGGAAMIIYGMML